MTDALFAWWSDEHIRTFAFVPGQTWLSSWFIPLVVPFLYLLVLHVVKIHVQLRRKPYDLNSVVVLHNSLLSMGSAVLFIALGAELVRMVNESTFFSVFCDVEIRWNHGRAYFLYYLNYLFKYVELFDTVLLVLRGKPTPFLHVYHHAATLVLCWSQMRAQSCLQWAVIIINLFVHIVMYLYYALHALGIDVWWKRYLTVTQIVQFVVALSACVIGLLSRTLNALGVWWLPRCHGEWLGAYFGVGVLATYLYLFVELYKDMYKAKQQSGAGRAHGAGHRVHNGLRLNGAPSPSNPNNGTAST